MGGPRGRKLAIEHKACAIKLIQEAAESGSKKYKACEILGINIRTAQRWKNTGILSDRRKGPLAAPSHQLTDNERMQIISAVNSSAYAHMPPCQIVPALADKGIYIASESSFYRVLKENHLLNHRVKQRRSTHSRPKVYVATAPNQVWSWDITYLPTAVKGLFYYLYLFIDIYSRKIVGFGVYDSEKSEYAVEVIEKACISEKILRNQIVVHSDNGSPMKGSTLLATFQSLGITPSYSRPSVSNDNPYSEAMFRTLKYCCWYPRHPFESLMAARHWMIDFANWYNNEHLHSGLKFITPIARHEGLDSQIMERRKILYEQAKQNNPFRWTGSTRNWELPSEVYLNPPKQKLLSQSAACTNTM